MQQWLIEQNIDFPPNALKAELWDIIKAYLVRNLLKNSRRIRYKDKFEVPDRQTVFYGATDRLRSI